MKTLFELLEAIITTGHQDEILADADQVVSFAENCNMHISQEMAESVISVYGEWSFDRDNGNGEWERMRQEAEVKLECYMNDVSGYVATVDMLNADYEADSVHGFSNWFGKNREECEGLDWLADVGLTHVEWNGSEWVEA